MTKEEKLQKIENLANDIETNRVRLEQARQSMDNYLEKSKELNEKMMEILSIQTDD